jgi:hypothetical protein
LEKERKIPYDEAERMAECFNCPYIETSAKADVSSENNVDTAFELALIQLFKKEKKLRDSNLASICKRAERAQVSDDSCCNLF